MPAKERKGNMDYPLGADRKIITREYTYGKIIFPWSKPSQKWGADNERLGGEGRLD